MDTSTLDLESTQGHGQASSNIIPPGGTTFQYYPPYFWDQQQVLEDPFSVPPRYMIPTGQPLAPVYPMYPDNFGQQNIMLPGFNSAVGHSWRHGPAIHYPHPVLPYPNMQNIQITGFHQNRFGPITNAGRIGNQFPTQQQNGPGSITNNEPVLSGGPDFGASAHLQHGSQNQAPVQGSRRSQLKYSYCTLCKSNGELMDYYINHTLKDESGKTLCPVLRALVCRICGATGDNSHTQKYCPNNMDPINSASGFQYRMKYNSTGTKKVLRYH